MIEWLWPVVLLLAPLPWLVRRLAPTAKSRQPALRAPFYQEWTELSERQGATGNGGANWSLAGLWVIWLLLLMALARPVWVGEPIELPKSGRDLMLAVDISGSMRVEDMKLGQVTARRIDAGPGPSPTQGALVGGLYRGTEHRRTTEECLRRFFLPDLRRPPCGQCWRMS